jgi:hypothetical protein
MYLPEPVPPLTEEMHKAIAHRFAELGLFILTPEDYARFRRGATLIVDRRAALMVTGTTNINIATLTGP